MSDFAGDIKKQIQQFADSSRSFSYPQNHDVCLFAASKLTEQAGDHLAATDQGNRVSELMLLAARVEALMKVPPSE